MTATRQTTKAKPMIKPPRRVSSLEAMLIDLCCGRIWYGFGLGKAFDFEYDLGSSTAMDDGRCGEGRDERGRKAAVLIARENESHVKSKPLSSSHVKISGLELVCADYSQNICT